MLRALQWEHSPAAQLQYLARRAVRPTAIALAMLLAMRAELLLRASPMAAALMAAALAAGENAAALVAGCLLGMLRLPLSRISLLPAISCVLVLGAELIFSILPFRLRISHQMRASLTAGLAALLPAMVQANGEAMPSLQALSCGILAAASAPYLISCLRIAPRRTRLSMQEKTGAALLAGTCIAALQAILPPIAEGLCTLMILLLPGFAPASGILAGLALAAGGAGLMKTASLALCALACSIRGLNLRWQKSLALCAAAALAQVIAGPSALDVRWALCAAALYPILPQGMAAYLAELSAPPRQEACDPDAIAREVSLDARRRLSALSDAFGAMAEGGNLSPDVPDEQELIFEMRSRLCTGCTGYAGCWAGSDNRAVHLLCRLIADALDRIDAPPGMRILFSDGEIPPDVLRVCRRGRMIPDRLGLLLRDFAEKRRSEIKRCETNQLLALQFMQAQEILNELARQQTASAGTQRLQSALDGAGLGDCTAISHDREAARLTLLRPGGWTREDACRAGSALSRAMGGRYRPCPDGDALRLTRLTRLSADAGASCQSGVPGEICGDSHLVRMLGESRMMLVISDGMGSGEAASAESLEALRLLWRFLDAGISRPLALETVNQQLLMRSGEDIFATIDLCIIDLNSGVAEFTKLAACRTIILRGGELLRIDGGRLPLGIVERVQPSVSRVRLRPGDVLVMGSDGVMEAGDALLVEHLARDNAACPPQQLAEQLVREANLARSHSRRDDLTCICARIHDSREAG